MELLLFLFFSFALDLAKFAFNYYCSLQMLTNHSSHWEARHLGSWLVSVRLCAHLLDCTVGIDMPDDDITLFHSLQCSPTQKMFHYVSLSAKPSAKL